MRRVFSLMAVVLSFLIPATASAGGLVVYDEADRAAALGTLQQLDVDVRLTDSAAQVTEQRRYVVQTEVGDQKLRFYRPTDQGATESLRVTVGSEEVPIVTIGGNYSLLRRRQLVRDLREPGVLRGVGQPLAESATFTVPDIGYNVVELVVTYRVPLASWDTLRGLRVPIDWQEEAVGTVNVTVTAETEEPLRALYSPYHALQVVRSSDHAATASYAGWQVCTTNDLVLLLSTGTDDVQLDVLPYRYGDADGGFFMALLTPSNNAETIPRDLVFVIDTSGSMDGEKMQQAREALRSVIEGLSSKDRFTIVEFANRATTLHDEAQFASRDFVGEATGYVDGLVADGGTNLYDALQTGFDALPYSEDRPRYVVVLTDGQPTEGETDTEAILDSVTRRNEGQARVFAFGIGDDVNTVLLDRLALDSAGNAIYIRPGESVVGPVETFFDSIAGAALVNPSLTSTDFAWTDAFPETLPDLFANQTLAVVGRYDRGGSGEVVLRGTSGGEELVRRFDVQLPEYSTHNGHVPRIWATRYVGTLLQEIKLGDADPALPALATEVASRFGVVTEFTNFVLDEHGNAVMRYTNVPLDVTGSTAVDTSASLDGYQNSGAAGATFEDFVRYVGARTLPTYDGWFTDTAVDAPNWVDVRFGSDLFMALVAERPSVTPMLAAARDVAFELHGVDYRISDGAADREVPGEADALPPVVRAPETSHATAELRAEEVGPIRSTAPSDSETTDVERRGLSNLGCSTPGSVPGAGALWLVLLAFAGRSTWSRRLRERHASRRRRATTRSR